MLFAAFTARINGKLQKKVDAAYSSAGAVGITLSFTKFVIVLELKIYVVDRKCYCLDFQAKVIRSYNSFQALNQGPNMQLWLYFLYL